MKTKLFVLLETLSLLFIISVCPAYAQSTALHVHVPFAFSVAGSKLPPGDYSIQSIGQGGLLLISDRGAGHSAALLTTGGNPYSTDVPPGMTFERRGREVYLSRVHLVGEPVRMLLQQ